MRMLQRVLRTILRWLVTRATVIMRRRTWSMEEEHRVYMHDSNRLVSHRGLYSSYWNGPSSLSVRTLNLRNAIKIVIFCRCVRLESRQATIEELRRVHSTPYVDFFGAVPVNGEKRGPMPLKSFIQVRMSTEIWQEMRNHDGIMYIVARMRRYRSGLGHVL